MKHLRSLIPGLLGALIIFQLTAVFPAAAQTVHSDSEQQRLAWVMRPDTDPEAFRAEMIDYVAEMQSALLKFESNAAVKTQLRKSHADWASSLERAKSIVAGLSADELVKMRAAYAKVPNWRESSRGLDALAQRVAGQKAASETKGEAGDNVITPDDCPDISETPSHADIAITKGFEIAGELAMELMPTDGITIGARAAVTTIRAGLQAASLSVDTLKAQYDACHEADVQSIINEAVTTITANDNSNYAAMLSAISSAKTDIVNNNNAQTITLSTGITNAVTSINNNSNANATAITTAITNAQNTIVNNDNSNTAALNTNINNTRTAIINNDNANAAALTNLLLRTQIEADLAEADNATFVVFYVMPTADGGHFSFARSIVVETIAKLAGENTAMANEFLGQSDAYRNVGNYKAAYQFLRKAYKAAVK